MNNSSHPLAVIVINYKMEDLTIRFVRQEIAKVTTPHIIVVVNNEATDASNTALCNGLDATLVTGEQTKISNDNDIYVLPSKENSGFARGNNLGADFCRRCFAPQYLLFSNNDIELEEDDVVEKMIRKMDETPEAGVMGPRVVGLDGREQSPHPYVSFWDRMVWMYWSTFFYSKEKKNRRFRFDYPQKAEEGYHYYVMGSFFIVRAADFYQCGMMDSNTFMYAEELILSERMKAIGQRVYYYPLVTVIHVHGATTKKFARTKSRDWKFKSLMYYYKSYRHTGWTMRQAGRLTHWLMKIKNI